MAIVAPRGTLTTWVDTFVREYFRDGPPRASGCLCRWPMGPMAGIGRHPLLDGWGPTCAVARRSVTAPRAKCWMKPTSLPIRRGEITLAQAPRYRHNEMQTRAGFPTLGSPDRCLKDRVHLSQERRIPEQGRAVNHGAFSGSFVPTDAFGLPGEERVASDPLDRGVDLARAVLRNRTADASRKSDRSGRAQSGARRQGGSHRFTAGGSAGHGQHRGSGLRAEGAERLQRTLRRVHLLSPAAAVQ